MDLKESYSTLGLAADASFEEVHAKYLQLSKKYHPDGKLNISQKDRIYYEERFKEINEAYSKIKEYNTGKINQLSDTKEKRTFTDIEIAKAYYLKGIGYFKEGDINNALDCFLNAHRKDENNPVYLRYLVKALMDKERRLHEAKEYCLKLIKLEDYNGENFYLLGKIYYKANLSNTALNYFKKAEKLNFNHPDLSRYISELDKDKGFARKVLSIFSKK